MTISTTPESNTITTTANAINNKEHNITSSMLPKIPTLNTSSFATNYAPEFSFDEQILSPSNSYCSERKTPFSVTTEDNNSFEENNLFYDSDNMCDNSLIDFEDDMLRFSKHAEITEKDIIESYEAKKPMPMVMVHLASVQDEYYNKNELVVDDSLCVKTDLSSQVSANMVIYPTENEIDEKSEVFQEHDYTTPIENIYEEKVKVVVENIPTNNNNNNHSINHNKNKNNDQRRVTSLTLKIPKPAFQDVVNTPDITNDILELEEKFDLVNYITKNVSLFK